MKLHYGRIDILCQHTKTQKNKSLRKNIKCATVKSMNLKQWIYKKGYTQSYVAFLLEINPCYLSRILAGKHSPGIKLASRIEELTSGEVNIIEILNIKNKQTNKVENGKPKNTCNNRLHTI